MRPPEFGPSAPRDGADSPNSRQRDGAPLIQEALLVRVADRLRVLGQPVRLRLLEQLIVGPSTPQELSDRLGLSQQNVSKHLLSLHRSGIVSRRPEGTNVFYTLVDETAAAVLRLTLESVTQQLRELAELAAPKEAERRGATLPPGPGLTEDRRTQGT